MVRLFSGPETTDDTKLRFFAQRSLADHLKSFAMRLWPAVLNESAREVPPRTKTPRTEMIERIGGAMMVEMKRIIQQLAALVCLADPS